MEARNDPLNIPRVGAIVKKLRKLRSRMLSFCASLISCKSMKNIAFVGYPNKDMKFRTYLISPDRISEHSKISFSVVDLKSTYSVNSVPTYRGIDIPIDKKLSINEIKHEARAVN